MLYLGRQCWRRVVSWAVTVLGFLTVEYALFRAAVLAPRRFMSRYNRRFGAITAECAPQATASLRLEVPVVNRILKLRCFSWYPCQVACYDVLVDVGLQIII